MSKSNADYAVECAQQLSRHDPQRSALIRMSMAIRDLQPQQRKPLTDEQESILNFLLGANDFEGVWYGERHPQKKGAFWWRDELRKAFQEAAHGIKPAVIRSFDPVPPFIIPIEQLDDHMRAAIAKATMAGNE